MLKLVENGQEPNRLIEIDERRNLCFFDELIAQIKYSHVDEIWHAQLKDLQELIDTTNHKKRLRAL